MSSMHANAADSYHDCDVEQAIGGAVLCERRQGDKGAIGSRMSDQCRCIMMTTARGDGKGKCGGAKGDAKSSSTRGWV